MRGTGDVVDWAWGGLPSGSDPHQGVMNGSATVVPAPPPSDNLPARLAHLEARCARIEASVARIETAIRSGLRFGVVP